MDKKNIITLWGILDISALVWYVGLQILHGQIPFYHDILKSIQLGTSFGMPSMSIITIFACMLYISLLFSGYYLIKGNKIGAILSYIQTPFRIITFIPPSIFFITWPLKYFFNSEAIGANVANFIFDAEAIAAIATLVALMLLSETLKLYSVITWRKKMKSS